MKEEFQSFLDQLKGTLTTLGQSFGETFKQVGQVAAQQGGQLLQQALQQGAQLAAQGAQSKIFVLLGTRAENITVPLSLAIVIIL